MLPLKIGQWRDKINTVSQPLRDSAHDHEIYQGQIEKNIPIPFDSISCTVAGEASVYLFNEDKDNDAGGVIGKASTNTQDDFVLPPAIIYNNDNAWLKYSVAASFKATASANVDIAKLGFGIEGSFVLSSYVIHQPAEVLSSAMAADLPKIRTVVSQSDVNALKIGEALSLQTRGKLSANVALSWSDILTNSLSTFGRLLGVDEVFNVTLAAAATVSVAVEVEDDYVLVVSRPQQDKLNVGVKKAKSNTLGVSIGATITASFTNSDDIIGLLNPLVSGLVDQPIDKIDELLAKLSYDDLSDELKVIADMIAKRLRLDDAKSAFNSLKEKLVEIKNDAVGAIKKAANSKAEIAFAYEYKRVEQSQMMLEVLMSDDQFGGYHKSLIKGDLTLVVDEVRKPDSAIKLNRYLNQETLEVSTSFGFSFGLGDWSVKSADVSSFKEVKRTDFQGHQQISFKGSKGFEGSSREWTTDFNASMAQFSKTKIPAANEFDFAYSVNHQTSGQSASAKVLSKMVDLALLWHIIPQGEGEELVASLKEKLAGQNNITFNHSIKLDNDAFNAILPDLKIHDNQGFGACLGQAMPWDGGFDSWLNLPSRRMAVYGPLWISLLEGKLRRRSERKSTAQSHVKQFSKSLAGLEDNTEPKNITFMGTSDEHSKVERDWENFVIGMDTLHQAIERGGDYNKIKEAFKSFDDMGNNNFYIRALGAYLLTLVQKTPIARANCECVLTISYTKGGEKIVETIGTGR